MKYYILTLFALFSVNASFSGCGSGSSATDVWSVLFTSLPEKIQVDNIDDAAVTYVFKQTHEPLFRREDGENFRSGILSNWTRDIYYLEYKLWPNTSLKFDEKTSFSAEYLYSFLVKVSEKYGVVPEVSQAHDHVVVKFKTSQPGYLRFLSQYKNAPSISNGIADEGLGAFAVKNISKSRIELERKLRVSNGYNKIILYAYEGPKDPNLQSRLVSDFNKLSSFQRPEWIKSEYRGFDNIELRVVGLAINHPDSDVRRVLYNCIDVAEFRQAAIPGRKDFYNIQTLLPVGVPGAKNGKPEQSCFVPSRVKGKTVVFANPRSDNQEELAAFAESFNKKTGLNLVIRKYMPEVMHSMVFGVKSLRPYNLVIVVSENPNSSEEDFFAFYAGEERAINIVSESIKENFLLLRKEGYVDKKRTLAENLAEKLREEWLALPLYQTTAKLYYHPKIKNLSVGRGFMETPDVADLRW